MAHQHFEEWLLSEDKLTPEQGQALQQHLKTCQSCTALASAWEQVRLSMGNAGMIAPAPGFVDRWQDRMVTRRLIKQRRQAWMLLGLNWAIAAVLFILIVLQVIPALTSPTGLVVNFVARCTETWAFMRVVVSVVSSLAGTLPGLVPVSWWVSIIASLGALMVLWISTLRRYALPQGVAE